MKPYAFHPEAAEEYENAAHFYKAISAEVGARFYQEIERVILEIRRQPGKFFRFCPPAQRALTRKFPYLVVYLDQPDRIWIVAIMHAKRRPGYWRERL